MSSQPCSTRTDPAIEGRRSFLKATAAAAVGLPAVLGEREAAAGEKKTPPIPRWRGFNLLSFFQALSRDRSHGKLDGDELRWMRDWGFDYVRLPLDYWTWIDADWRATRTLKPDDVFRVKNQTLDRIDSAVELCQKFGLHVNLNFHRAPGYCINNPEREPFVLWSDKRAEDAFLFHWRLFARRYKSLSRDRLSFNLVNEAPRPRAGYMSREDYIRVMTRGTEAIREIDPQRRIFVDGLSVAHDPVEELVGLGVGQSTHAYWPGGISHYRAPWVDRNAGFPTPSWPLKDKLGRIKADRQKLVDYFAPWQRLMRRGIAVHCGECGCYNKTPYDVFLGWFTDVMDILKSHGIGYALWNFSGAFGILDSGRSDAKYEEWHGHQLDRTLLTLLQRH